MYQGYLDEPQLNGPYGPYKNTAVPIAVPGRVLIVPTKPHKSFTSGGKLVVRVDKARVACLS